MLNLRRVPWGVGGFLCMSGNSTCMTSWGTCLIFSPKNVDSLATCMHASVMQFSTCLPQHSNRRKKTSDMHTKKKFLPWKSTPRSVSTLCPRSNRRKKNATSHAHKTRKVSFRVWKAAPNCANLSEIAANPRSLLQKWHFSDFLEFSRCPAQKIGWKSAKFHFWRRLRGFSAISEKSSKPSSKMKFRWFSADFLDAQPRKFRISGILSHLHFGKGQMIGLSKEVLLRNSPSLPGRSHRNMKIKTNVNFLKKMFLKNKSDFENCFDQNVVFVFKFLFFVRRQSGQYGSPGHEKKVEFFPGPHTMLTGVVFCERAVLLRGKRFFA